MGNLKIRKLEQKKTFLGGGTDQTIKIQISIFFNRKSNFFIENPIFN